MKQTVKVIFGKEQVIKAYNNELLSEQEINIYVKNYEFNTVEEKLAFIKGVYEAIGWVEICIPEFEFQS